MENSKHLFSMDIPKEVSVEDFLKSKTRDELILLILEKEGIPVSVFHSELGPLGAVVRYLKEHKNMRNCDIAKLLGKDQKSIWISYNNAKKKEFVVKESEYSIPLKELCVKKLSVLESVCFYLKNLNLRYSEIGKILGRDERTIWTVYQKAKKKVINES